MINNKERVPMAHYTALYAAMGPERISARCEVPFIDGAFQVRVCGFALRALWPEFQLLAENTPCPKAILGSSMALLVIRYLTEGAAAPASGRFLPYRELPWGDVYDANFQGRCIRRLAFSFGGRLEDFKRAAEELGGTPSHYKDVSFNIPFFEKVSLILILRAGDEEFPPTSQFLFSDNASAAFTAEDLAVAGEVVITALKECAT